MATIVPMSSQSIPNASPDSVPTKSKKTPGRPLPLSASQEQQVRDLYYKNVRAMCADEIKAFAECAHSRTVTATFVCRDQRNAMNSCMVTHATQDNMDAARTEWFNSWRQRKAAKEAEEKKLEEAKKFHAEWWGLDESGKRREHHPNPEDSRHAEELKRRERELREIGVNLEKGRQRR